MERGRVKTQDTGELDRGLAGARRGANSVSRDSSSNLAPSVIYATS